MATRRAVSFCQGLPCAFTLSEGPVPLEPWGAPLIHVGEVGGQALGPYGALIEEIG